VKESGGALYDRMWGSYGCEVVRARVASLPDLEARARSIV
jgi:hypothetical protein